MAQDVSNQFCPDALLVGGSCIRDWGNDIEANDS